MGDLRPENSIRNIRSSTPARTSAAMAHIDQSPNFQCQALRRGTTDDSGTTQRNPAWDDRTVAGCSG